ncbi:MAG: hypothetical protein AAFW69_09330, partial [Pseudomonadota bacterium]
MGRGVLAAWTVAALLTGCSVAAPAPETVPSPATMRLLAPVDPPVLLAEAGAAGDVLTAAERIGAGALDGRRGTRSVAADQVPLLWLSPEGRRFLAIGGPRALV